MKAPFLFNQKAGTSGAVTCIKLYCDLPSHHAVLEEIGAPITIANLGVDSNWIGEINRVWSRGTGNSLELAKVVWDARRRLPYGRWAQLWKSGQLPFSKRKGEMLVVIGDRLGWLDAQMFAHLPAGWSILYQLVQLSRAIFEHLIQEGVIHPKLRLQEAKGLVARFNGRHNQRTLRETGVKRRLQQFRGYVRRNLKDWKPEECELAKKELTRVLELIDTGGGCSFERIPGKRQVGPSTAPKKFHHPQCGDLKQSYE